MRYTLVDHAKSSFPLAGGHKAVPCADCHHSASAAEPIQYHGLRQECAACHENPHSDAASPALKGNWSCDQCHTARNWRETAPFDHGRTAFPLLGRHRGAPCVGCHKPATANARRTIVFHTAGKECAACHADVHAGQFRGSGQPQPDCGRCHGPTNWRADSFDHQKHSTFSLSGAHERVPCRMCHTGCRCHRKGGCLSRNSQTLRGMPRMKRIVLTLIALMGLPALLSTRQHRA